VSVEFKDPEKKAASPRWLLCKAWAVGPSRDTQYLGLKVSHGDPYRAVSVSALSFSWGFSIDLIFPRVSTPSIVDSVKSSGSQNYILVST